MNITDNDLGYSSLRVHTAEGQWGFVKQMARTEGAQTHPGLSSDQPNTSIETTGIQSTIGLDDTEFHKHGTEDDDDRPPQASPSMQFWTKQVRDRNFADSRVKHLAQEVVLDNCKQ